MTQYIIKIIFYILNDYIKEDYRIFCIRIQDAG